MSFFNLAHLLSSNMQKGGRKTRKILVARLLNRLGRAGGSHLNCVKDLNLGHPFVYKHIGCMASSAGRYKTLVDLRKGTVPPLTI